MTPEQYGDSITISTPSLDGGTVTWDGDLSISGTTMSANTAIEDKTLENFEKLFEEKYHINFERFMQVFMKEHPEFEV